jgi:hypothetical protein
MSEAETSPASRSIGFYLTRQSQFGFAEITAQLVVAGLHLDARESHAVAACEGFRVVAHAGYGGCSGTRHEYHVPNAAPEQAAAMGRILAVVDEALDRKAAAEGPLDDADFLRYLLRVAEAVGATFFAWRPKPDGAVEHTDAAGVPAVLAALVPGVPFGPGADTAGPGSSMSSMSSVPRAVASAR